ITGQFIAAGGRIISKETYLAKYVNSPETKFFKKGNNLYNLNKARKFSNSHDEVFLVEGYMDVIGLSKNKIENCVANLGTALTDRQILVLNQFFNEITICFDSDESGYKAAVRAAENSIKELKPDKQIFFLFLPNGEDPDSFVNNKGKDFFLNYNKEKKIPIHVFLFEHYKKQSTSSPSSLAIFEKRLRDISKQIKDELIRKYILDFFIGKISELAPNISRGKQYTIKHVVSLSSTKKKINESKSLSKAEIKEFSLLYLIINNLSFFKANYILFENLEFITKEGIKLFSYLNEFINTSDDLEKVNLDIENNFLERINKFASIKHISENVKKDENK
ncbi:toprim domain-containing protein, partial [Pelagibacterales bacterium SAG-MED15]|nr:toprim domain-containing protein [Pelagibacterales bacterium SAG-MED15]